MFPGLVAPDVLAVGQCFALDVGVENDVERLRRSGVDVRVLADADIGEECLVGQTQVLVVAAGADPSEVAGEVQAVVDVRPAPSS